MRSPLKLTFLAAAAGLLGTILAAPAIAQVSGPFFYEGPVIRYYQAPDGSYASQSDFLSDINGTPCGVECTRAAQARWSHYYDRPYGQ